MAWVIDIQEREIQGIDYGFDVSGVDDISKSFTTSKELRLLAEALLRRLITGKGTLFYDLTYGYDLRMLLNSKIKDFEKANILEIPPFNSIGKPTKIIKLFGGKVAFEQAIRELEYQIYKSA